MPMPGSSSSLNSHSETRAAGISGVAVHEAQAGSDHRDKNASGDCDDQADGQGVADRGAVQVGDAGAADQGRAHRGSTRRRSSMGRPR